MHEELIKKIEHECEFRNLSPKTCKQSIAYYSDANRARIMGGQSDIRTTQRYLNKSITPKDYETVEKAFDYRLSTNFDQDLGKEKTS